jgi:hypothetical protein
MKETTDLATLVERRVTGDAVRAITVEVRRAFEANSSSIYFYAFWRALLDLAGYFEEEQGIPIAEWDRINLATKSPLRNLVEVGGLEEESSAATHELRKLIQGLHSLRSTMD